MGRLKELLFRDVENKNESSKNAIVLRMSSIGIIIYLLSVLVVMLGVGGYPRSAAMELTLASLMLIVVWQTYNDQTKAAGWMYNIITIVGVVANVLIFGWKPGFQFFLFTLILVDLFFAYMNFKMQVTLAVLLCAMRIALYGYCEAHEPLIILSERIVDYIQVASTIVVYLEIFFCGYWYTRDTQEMERKLMDYNKELQAAASTDPLTGLWNRARMIEYANKRMKKHLKEKDGFMSLAIGDIDFFKRINDTYGHECGDVVLKEIANLFNREMKDNGAVARWGGEEFLFFFDNANGDEAWLRLGAIQIKLNHMKIVYEDITIQVTMTCGLVELDPAYSLDDNVKIADDRLYRGKDEGRNRIVY